MSQPKISVIIPIYNTEAYVAQAIESICTQTLREIEIIAINDGSTDRSLELITQIAKRDSRIKVYTQSNQGLSVTRNRGVDLAQGQYIHFMDSDDLLEKEALQMCYDKCERDNLDMVIFDAESFCDEGSFMLDIDYKRSHLIGENVYSGMQALDILLSNNVFRSTACLHVVSTEFLRHTGLKYMPGIIHEDELFTPLLYIYADRLGAISRSFFHRRLRGNSIMMQHFAMRNMECYLIVIDQLLAFGKGKQLPIKAMSIRLARRTLNGALYKATLLPPMQSLRVAAHCATKYPSHIRFKTIFRLIVKSIFRKK